MLISTAQSVASIQYQYPTYICTPSYGIRKGCQEMPYPYVVRLSDNRPENSILAPSFISQRWSAIPNPASLDEILDWDFLAGPDPARPLGTIPVTLEYIGRVEPADIQDIWD